LLFFKYICKLIDNRRADFKILAAIGDSSFLAFFKRQCIPCIINERIFMNYLMQFSFIPATLLLLVLFAACGASDSGVSDSGPVTFSDENDKASYIIGFQIGQDFKRSYMDEINVDLLARAIKDVLADVDPAMEDAEMQEVMQKYMAEQKVKQQALHAQDLEKNGADAKAYLDENGKKDGVITLPSGLQYTILTEGSGDVPKTTDTVRVHYKGTLLDGKTFDSSYDRGEPVEFPVTGVIKGWTEALQLMPVGSKWQLVIPSELAYGEQGNQAIPPNSLLVFDVELLAIVDAAE